MSEATSSAAPAATADALFVDRHGFWGNFYRMVWGLAALMALMLILMAIFLT
ncbi:MAG: hypothetical protein ACREFP_27300 [Acetobacteraceae bacterium]